MMNKMIPITSFKYFTVVNITCHSLWLFINTAEYGV
jgi:hypothetical protein